MATLLVKGCKTLQIMTEFKEASQLLLYPERSPGRNVDPDRQFSPALRSSFEWLCNLPKSVVQDVVVDVLAKLDVSLEKNMMKEEDFVTFTMFSVVQVFELKSLQFSDYLTW